MAGTGGVGQRYLFVWESAGGVEESLGGSVGRRSKILLTGDSFGWRKWSMLVDRP